MLELFWDLGLIWWWWCRAGHLRALKVLSGLHYAFDLMGIRNVTCRLGTHLWFTTMSWCPGIFFSLLSLNKKRGRQHEEGDHTAPTFSLCLLRNIGVYWEHTVYQFLSSGLCLYDLKESPNVLSPKCGQIKKRMSYSFSSVAMMKYSGRNNFREKG